MADVKWSKEVAQEIIKTGFIRLTKKYNPDLGGSHEEMLVLNATKAHLEKFLTAGSTDYNNRFTDREYWANKMRAEQARHERERREREARAQRERQESPGKRTRSQFWSKVGGEPSGSVPIQPYPHDSKYWMLEDVTVMTKSEKAIKIKIPNVSMPQWLPFSQMHADSEIGTTSIDGDVGQVVFTAWIAMQKGWLK